MLWERINMDDYYEKIITNIKTGKYWFTLSGKTAVVVGGTKGLGLAMALGLAGVGAKVCIASRNITTELRSELTDMFESIQANFMIEVLDATSETDVNSLFNKVEETLGSLDILINSQGSVYLEPSISFSVEHWQEVMDINIKSVFICCKNAAPHMMKLGRGKIINISSVRGFQGRAQDLAYAPSKGAVNQLTRSLAIEWGPLGINVNGLAPVFTKTKISEAFLKDKSKLDWVLGRIPMKRLGELEDIIGPAIFLSSTGSDFVNGHILPVDGGWLAG
jgi:NAD(P)-dependent dehydrogenase (short-subunit alcohol dehydrogenase family)